MTWDTLDTQAYAAQYVTLSGGGLTATGASTSLSSGTQGVAQPFEGKTAGKWCVEILCVTPGSGADDSVGLVNAAGATFGTQGGFIGATGGTEYQGQLGIGYRQDGDLNNNRLYLIGQHPIQNFGVTWGAGDYLYIAVDLDNGQVWFRKNGGAWQGLTNTGNPATNTGGIPFSGTTFAYPPQARVFPAAGMGNGGQYVFNLGASAFANSVPAGFTAGWTNTALRNFGSFLGNGLGAIYRAPAAGQVLLSPYVSGITGNITRLRSAGSSPLTQALGVVYDSDGGGGAPFTMLSKSAVARSGTELIFDLTSPLGVTLGHKYYLGVMLNNGLHDSLALAGNAPGLWTDNTASWPNPNATFTQSAIQNFHLPMLAEFAGGGGGGGGRGYSQGHIY